MRLFGFTDKNLNEKLNYQGKYEIVCIDSISEVDKQFNLGLIYSSNKTINEVISQLETFSDIPYIIIVDEDDKINKDKFYGISQVDIIHISEIDNVDEIISKYFTKKNKKGLSVFELTDIMQIVAMEKKDIAIKIINEKSIGVIVFKNGDPIYSKLNEDNKTISRGIEAAYRILSWNKPIFKLARLSKDVSNNLNTNLMNLLMGAMQYKDELLAKEKGIDIKEEKEKKKEEKRRKREKNKEKRKKRKLEEKKLKDEKSFNMDYSFDINEDNNLKNDIKEEKEEFIKLEEEVLTIFSKFDGLLDISVFRENNLIFSQNKKYKTLFKNTSSLLKSINLFIKNIELGYLDRVIINSDKVNIILEYNKKNKILIILLIKNEANLSMAKILSTNVKQMVASKLP